MRMRLGQGLVPVRRAMGFAWRVSRPMLMLMLRIMHICVLLLHLRVRQPGPAMRARIAGFRCRSGSGSRR